MNKIWMFKLDLSLTKCILPHPNNVTPHHPSSPQQTKRKTQCLPGTLAHLAALAPQPAHPLLAPLGTHAGVNSHGALDLLVSGEGGEESAVAGKLEELGGDKGGVLNGGLELGDSLDREGQRGFESGNRDHV